MYIAHFIQKDAIQCALQNMGGKKHLKRLGDGRFKNIVCFYCLLMQNAEVRTQQPIDKYAGSLSHCHCRGCRLLFFLLPDLPRIYPNDVFFFKSYS